MYSYVGPFGEAVPPQYHDRAPWIDEVWQTVAVVASKNVDPHKYSIHQAGAYMRDAPALDTPYFSPSIARHCTGRECSFATWGTQAHTPTTHKSAAIYMNRYRDCGDGVLEVSSVLHNFEPAEGGDTWTSLNVPLGGVRTSVLNDIVISQPLSGAAETKDLHAPMQAWGVEGHSPNASDTGGYTVYMLY